MGGADGTKPGAPKKSLPLTAEQQAILEKRGVLSPDEIHKLAAKTKKAVATASERAAQEAADASKLSCHSDYVDADTAQRLQEEKLGKGVLVQLDVRPALGIAKEDRVV